MSDHRQPCPALTASGAVCNTPTTRYFDGLGWRCRWHAEGQWPKSETEPEAPKPNPPPVETLTTLRDAERLMEWVAMEVAFGRMDKDQAQSVIQAAREWRAAYGERKLKKEQDSLRRQLKNIKHAKSERGAKQETEEDDDE